MFTGIVEEVGEVASLERSGDKARLTVGAKKVLEDSAAGDSICVEGVCQTVTAILPGAFTVDVLAESLKKTSLGSLRPGDPVNLERSLRADARLGGHFVQGHVNAACPIRRLDERGGNVYLAVEIPDDLLRYCVREGSIALDGISLTIAAMEGNLMTVNVIPITWKNTSLRDKKPGALMNVEVDVLGRYVERLLAFRTGEPAGLTGDRMKELGY